MAKNNASTDDEPRIARISADSKQPKQEEEARAVSEGEATRTHHEIQTEAVVPASRSLTKADKPKRRNPLVRLLLILTWPFRAIGRYVKESWQELRQVHWPTRGATWRMTAALLAFTLLFAFIILSIDILFDYLFKLIIG